MAYEVNVKDELGPSVTLDFLVKSCPACTLEEEQRRRCLFVLQFANIYIYIQNTPDMASSLCRMHSDMLSAFLI